MTEKRKRPRLGTVRQRFCFYVDELFGGNQRRTAEHLGCSQAVISKIKLGKQDVGGHVLDLLTQHPKVNPTWLMQGKGEPLLAGNTSATDQGWAMPVAEELLPGPPKYHREHLTGQVEYVAGILYRDTAYIYVVRDSHVEHILPGDRILLDANTARWRKNLRVLDAKLCAVRRNVSGGAVIELRRLSCRVERSGEAVQLREYHSRPSRPQKHPDANKELTSIQLDDPSTTPTQESRSDAAPKTFDVIAVNDVVAVAIELFRRL